MKCKYCNAKIKKDDVYCSECGKSLKENVLVEIGHEICNFFKKIGKFIYNSRKVIFSILLTLIILFGLVKITLYVFGPEYMAKKYIKAVSNNDYSEIYKLLDVDKSSLVSEKILKEKMETIDIDAYEVDNVVTDGEEAIVTFKYEHNNKINYVSVVLRNSMIKKYYLFNNWKILSTKVAKDVVIEVPKNSIVKIDNKEISEFKVENENYDIYKIEEMFAGTYKISIELENGLKVEDDVEIYSNKKYSIGNIELEEKIKKDLISQLESSFNTLYINAINGISYNDIGLTNLKTEYNYLKESLKNNSYTLTNISFSDIDVIGATYDQNLEVTFNLNCNYTVEYKLNEEVKTYSGSGSTKVKANYNATKDTYTLDSISNLPISFRIRY